MKAILKCQLTGKTYNVKKVCKIQDMPKSANYWDTIYIDRYSQDIYKTDSFIFYAKHPTH